MNKNFLRILICALALPLTGCSTPLDRGNSYYQQGLYDQAAFQWNPIAQAGDPYAQYNLGLLWEQGLGSTQRNLNEAAGWYLKSAQQGFAPAMVRLAAVQISLGMEAPALTWLNLAARWGNQEAASILRSKSVPVPSPDLLQQNIAAQERASQENVDALMGLIFIGAMIEGASNGAVVNPGYIPTVQTNSPPRQTYQSSPSVQNRATGGAGGISGTRMCPDGSYVAGSQTCLMAPDGTYVTGGRGTRMCPDGTYVSGTQSCALTPTGTYVEGGRGTTMCPDGTFVAGVRCQMAPDGKYVGVDK